MTRACLLLCALASSPALHAGRAADVRLASFELLNEGVSAYNRADYPLAVSKLRASAAIALNSFRAHYYLGLAEIGNRDYPAAVEALEVALDLDPQHLQSLVALGDAWLKQGTIDEARAAYTRALKLRAAYPEALDGMARSYEAEANEKRAIELYREAIASNRGFAPAHTHLGDLYLRRGETEQAIRLLEEAIDIRPDYAPGLNRLALAYGQLGLHNEALATIAEAIALEPGSAVHLVTRGRLELAQGFLGGAERSFRGALDLEAGMPEARAGLAAVAHRRGDYDAALAELDAALGDGRLDALAARQLGELRAAVELERVEVAALELRLGAGTATPADRGRLADLYAGRALWERAADLQRGAGDSHAARERLAYLLFRAGRFREAYDLYARLVTESPRVEIKLNTAIALALLGDDEGAAPAYRDVLAADPANRRAWLYLGNSLLRLGRVADAAEAYRKSLEDGTEDEAAERVRRILQQIAPEPAASRGPEQPS